MITKELIEYLEQFDSESELSIVIANTEKRLHHIASSLILITGEDNPAILIDTLSDEPLDDIND